MAGYTQQRSRPRQKQECLGARSNRYTFTTNGPGAMRNLPTVSLGRDMCGASGTPRSTPLGSEAMSLTRFANNQDLGGET